MLLKHFLTKESRLIGESHRKGRGLSRTLYISPDPSTPPAYLADSSLPSGRSVPYGLCASIESPTSFAYGSRHPLSISSLFPSFRSSEIAFDVQESPLFCSIDCPPLQEV